MEKIIAGLALVCCLCSGITVKAEEAPGPFEYSYQNVFTLSMPYNPRVRFTAMWSHPMTLQHISFDPLEILPSTLDPWGLSPAVPTHNPPFVVESADVWGLPGISVVHTESVSHSIAKGLSVDWARPAHLSSVGMQGKAILRPTVNLTSVQLHLLGGTSGILEFPMTTSDRLVFTITSLVPNVWTVNIYRNDVLLDSTGNNARLEVRTLWAVVSHVAPVWVALPDARSVIGTTVDWTYGVSARWGVTVGNSIPTLGLIDNLSLDVNGTDPNLSSSGVHFDRIGARIHTLRARDNHSLSPLYPLDNTQITGTRKQSVYTLLAPALVVRFADGALLPNGYPMPVNTVYDAVGTNLYLGTEDGWTNQPLNITVDPDTILGTFDTVLRLPLMTEQTMLGAAITYANYATPSTTSTGTPVSGVLTEVGVLANELSATVNGIVKIDTIAPVASATQIGPFEFTDTSTDLLSGISVVNYPTQIVFTTPSGSMVPPTTGWEDLDNHTMTTTGNYDVWVRATDKAGNETTTKVFANLFVGGEVGVSKDTDKGATLHTWDCTHYDGVTLEAGCELECSIGLSAQLDEGTAFTYELRLTNNTVGENAVGTFEDYLPKGVTLSATPTAVASGSAVVTVTSDLVTVGPYTGHYRISGTYNALTPGEYIDVTIPAEVPAFDPTPGETNIISNQATTDWTIGTGMTQITGSNVSNYANHEVLQRGVKTIFTKVGADDITTGLAGAEFALYRWDGATPTPAEQNHMVDSTLLVDATLPGGNWVRVKENGDPATSIADIFVSASSPLGEVNIGSLLDGYYTLIETKAPSGYELPIGQWILTIDQSKTDAIGDYKIEFAGKSQSIMPPAAVRETSGGVHSYKIINATPFLIGMSGLGGTASLLLAGFVLMAVAGNAYAAYSYKQNKKTKE